MNRKTGILAAALVILCVAAGVLFQMNKPETITGAKNINVIVIHADQTENAFSYETDAEYLGEVLLENELAEGDITDYGLFISTVDGETADSSKQQWWCITKGGESVTTGADSLPIIDGDQFELTLMEGY